MTNRPQGGHLHLELHVDRDRRVVSLAFTSSPARPDDAGPPPPPLHAARLVEAAPNVVLKVDAAGRLLGIDIFNAAAAFGLERIDDISFTLRTGR